MVDCPGVRHINTDLHLVMTDNAFDPQDAFGWIGSWVLGRSSVICRWALLVLSTAVVVSCCPLSLDFPLASPLEFPYPLDFSAVGSCISLILDLFLLLRLPHHLLPLSSVVAWLDTWCMSDPSKVWVNSEDLEELCRAATQLASTAVRLASTAQESCSPQEGDQCCPGGADISVGSPSSSYQCDAAECHDGCTVSAAVVSEPPAGGGIVPKMPSVIGSLGGGDVLAVPNPAVLGQASKAVGLPPRSRAAPKVPQFPARPSTMSQVPAEEPAVQVGGVQSTDPVMNALAQQSQALTALVAHLTSNQDPLQELHLTGSSGAASSTRGVQKRERLQAELASGQSQFFVQVMQQMHRRL